MFTHIRPFRALRWTVTLGVALGLCVPAFGSDDERWPREFTAKDGAMLVVHQPQVESWEESRNIVAVAAAVYTPAGGDEDHIGTVTLEAATATDHRERVVHFSSLTIGRVLFPTLDETKAKAGADAVRTMFPDKPFDVPLDTVLTNLGRSQVAVREVPVSNDPPRIIISEKDALLVRIHGEPQYETIKDTDIKMVVNTATDLFRHEASGKFYLLRDHTWMEAPELSGPWTANRRLPEKFFTLPRTARLRDVGKRVRGRTISSLLGPPDVHVVFEPTELIAVYGDREWETITGTKLKMLKNTESDIFLYSEDGLYYALFSGRWYRTKGSDKPLEFCTHNLPDDFARIPPESDAGRVLVSVPGTDQAREAVIAASIPRTATVRRRGAEVEVNYIGEPEFVPIDGTSVRIAVNTDRIVLEVDGAFYSCEMGVWFEASDATGPWRVCDDVPDAIYDIPPTSRAYPLTYVYVYESDPEEVVVGYLPGYELAFVSDGVLVYGSGYESDDTPEYYLSRYRYWTPLHFNYLRLRDTFGHGFYYDHLDGSYHRGADARAHAASRAIRLDPYATWTKSVTENRFNERGPQIREYTPPGRLVRGGSRLYAAPGGNVYRQDHGEWQRHATGGWRGLASTNRAFAVPNRVINSARGWGENRQSQFRHYRSTRGRATRSRQGLGAGRFR